MSPFATTRSAPEPLDVATHHAIRQVKDYAMFLIDRQGRAASWNEGVREILGWTEDDWLGQPVQVAFTPEDRAAGIPEHELTVACDEGRADDDRWMQRRDGKRFFANGSVTCIRKESGELVGYLKVLRDGTPLHDATEDWQRALQAEREARAQAERQAAVLQATIDAIPDALYIGTAEGITQCNPQALALLGADSLQDLQRDIGQLAERFNVRLERNGKAAAPEQLPFARALRGEQAALETWATRPNGEDVLIRGTAAPIVVDGRIIGAVAVNSDLTEHHRLKEQQLALAHAQERLRVRDEEFRALVVGVRDYAIFTIDPDGLISSWHEGAQLMKGYTSQEAIGMPFANLFTPEERAVDKPRREMEFAATHGEYKGEGPRLRKDGTIFDAAVVLTALRGPDGALLGYLKLTQDITSRRHLEQQQEQTLRNAESARRDAERASQVKTEFLATISHELRTPLSAILGWSQLLERGLADPKTVKHGLNAITRNARTQVQLIEDLLDMSRIESGQLKIQREPVDLSEAVAAAIEEVQMQARTKGVLLGTLIDPRAGLVMADPGRLQQILWNLLVNAVKFTPAGGRVTVSVRRTDDHVEIAVEDTGQGMTGDFIELAFNRFQQHDSTSTRRHGGLGLGLAIVRQLTQLHQGKVRAESPGPGLGSTFTVCLPALHPAFDDAALDRAHEAHAPEPLGDDHRLAGFSVLLVDDEPDARAVAAYTLRLAGADVTEAASAQAAFDVYQQAPPDAVLCDIGMPEHDGYEFIGWLRELEAREGRRTPAAAFTAYARSEDRQRAMEAGYQMHLIKPLDPHALVEATVSLLQRQAGPLS
ncbi:MAG: PAS domain S-box protein [Vitreoscilla sp.]